MLSKRRNQFDYEQQRGKENERQSVIWFIPSGLLTPRERSGLTYTTVLSPTSPCNRESPILLVCLLLGDYIARC